ncbi:hypothetical protein Tco_0778478 [Tanacetum coccineum]
MLNDPTNQIPGSSSNPGSSTQPSFNQMPYYPNYQPQFATQEELLMFQQFKMQQMHQQQPQQLPNQFTTSQPHSEQQSHHLEVEDTEDEEEPLPTPTSKPSRGGRSLDCAIERSDWLIGVFRQKKSRVVRNLEKIRQNRRDLPRDTPIDRIEVLRYDTKKEQSENGKNIIHDMSYHWNKPNKLKGKDTTISNLKKYIANLKGKAVADCSETINCSRVIALGMYKLDLEPLSPKLRKNRDTHVDYLKKAEEHTNTLRVLVEQARAHQPLNSALDYASCHDGCVVDYLNNVHERAKSRSAKSNKKKDWKPTGKVFTHVGYRWLPTRRTFTIDGTKCPMTRITSTKVVPPRESTQTTVITKITPSSISKRKPKETKSVSPSSEPSILGPRPSNNSEPNLNWGSMFQTLHLLLVSNACRTNHPLFLGTVRFGNDQVAKIMGSLRAKNLALLGKWWWRFRRDDSSLWVRVIKSIHRNNGGLGEVRALGEGFWGDGFWNDIMQFGTEIDGLRIDFSSSYHGELGDGRDIRFWIDRWVDNQRLCDRFPMLYHLDRSKEGGCGIRGHGLMMGDVGNGNGLEALGVEWVLSEDDGFTVKELPRLVEEKILHVESGSRETLWNKLAPKKVNIFV